jgi:hypothetical protein
MKCGDSYFLNNRRQQLTIIYPQITILMNTTLNLWITSDKIGVVIMENEEILQYLSKLDKKLDKILNMQTKIAKVLHLLPVTEKEERALQIQQRTNLNVAQKVSDELDAMSNISTDNEMFGLNIDLYKDLSTPQVYEDVIGSDIL